MNELRAHLVDADAPVPDDALLSCVLGPLVGGAATRLVLTRDPEAPWAVEETIDLHAGRTSFAALVEFGGPRSDEQVAADRFAHTHRVGPAATQVAGTGGAIVLRTADGACSVVALAASTEALQASALAINSTPLLPQEDPALLTGPDRVRICSVDGGEALVDALTSSPAVAR